MSRKASSLVQFVRVKYAIPHHARAIKPTVDTLLYALATSGLGTKWGKVRQGQNSWYVDVTSTHGTKRFHIRYRKNPDRIEINRGYYRPTTVASVQSELQVLRAVSQMLAGSL